MILIHISEFDASHQKWNPAEPLALFEWQGACIIKTNRLLTSHISLTLRGLFLVLVWTRIWRVLQTDQRTVCQCTFLDKSNLRELLKNFQVFYKVCTRSCEALAAHLYHSIRTIMLQVPACKTCIWLTVCWAFILRRESRSNFTGGTNWGNMHTHTIYSSYE